MSTQTQSTSPITKLNQSTVYSHILSFLRGLGLSSSNTQREYESDIRQFFLYTRNKPVEQLSITDLKFINSEVIDYRTYLSTEYITPKGTNYKNTSVNRKIDVLKSLFSFLKTNDYDVNPYVFKLKPLPDDSEGHGLLTFEESQLMAELALTEREKGKQKRLLILLAVRTSLRKDALLNLRYTDIRKDTEDKYIIEVWDSERQDKGKKIFKKISSMMYDELLSIKTDNDNIFNLDGKYINDTIHRLAEKMGISKQRRINFHSLKKTGIHYVYEITGGDIYAASAQGGHSNITTTAKNYMKQQDNLAGTTMDQNVDKEIFKKLSYDECIQLLESVENGLGSQLRNKAQNIIDKRS